MPASGNVWVDIFYLAALGLSVVGPLLYRIVGTRGLRARLRRPPGPAPPAADGDLGAEDRPGGGRRRQGRGLA